MMTDEGTTSRTDLSDLLRDRKAELDMSLRELVEACVDPENPDGGPLIRRTTLDGLLKADEAVKAPTVPVMRALAAGFRLPFGLIQEAAGAQYLGIDTVWTQDRKVRTLIHGFEEMDPADQDRVMALMESWRKLKRD
ncbi:XRE family transcriptional regulator [Streptomyces sp. NPDC096057]|uniref:XRE family transcriptional regulator n=1 Tax=Streptomyces sp. NPDC096057 TaxID=3155543 RepID=UPI0033330CAF